jgi:hypothetical protein
MVRTGEFNEGGRMHQMAGFINPFAVNRYEAGHYHALGPLPTDERFLFKQELVEPLL